MSFFSSSLTPIAMLESVMDKKIGCGSAGGRKSNEEEVAVMVEVSDEESSEVSLESVDSDVDVDDEEEYDDDEESEEEDFDEEEEEENRERIRILEDAMKLKKMAEFFMKPELPVEVDGFSSGRSYFSRPVADETDAEESNDARADVLADVLAMKKVAADYLHPEAKVEVDAACFGRNYFSQPWAAEEEEDDEEKDAVLEDLAAIKQAAIDFGHPEKAVCADPAAFGRNYFLRPSADEQEDDDTEGVLEELAALKQAAMAYRHPEKSLEVDPTVFGRSYYSRASATDKESFVAAEQRAQMVQEAAKLKEAATHYLHPEHSIATSPDVFGRNVFSTPAAVEQEDEDYDEEREAIMQELAALKKTAVAFLRPENPLEVDPTVFGRNYYSRACAPDKDSFAAAEQRAQVVEEAAKLKTMASQYLHPELPVATEASAFGRNYFSRPSAEDQEDDDTEEVLEELSALKQAAIDYRHPEKPLDVDPAVFGRNYYSRASAPDKDSFAAAEERAQMVEEAAKLKEAATHYLHPESPVAASSAAFGRNFYSSSLAAEHADEDDEEEREAIIQELAALKKTAVAFLHPEKPLEVDPTVFGRNYYSRASAPDKDSFAAAEHRAQMVQEAAKLKSMATQYLHPELPVSTAPTAFGRNYFARPSAPEYESNTDESVERSAVLEEAKLLSKLAGDYMHPEAALNVDAACFGRNFFGRYSADEVSDEADKSQVVAEAKALKNLAVIFRHPEAPVATEDPAARGRSYFARASAAGVAEYIRTSGHANVHEDEHSYHDDYGHFDMEEELFYDMRQTLVVPGESRASVPKVQSSKISSDEEGELSRSPSSVMLFTGALEDADHPALPTMG